MAPSMYIDVKMEKKKKKNKSKDLTEAEEVMDYTDDSSRKEKNKKKKDNDSALIQLIAKYLDKRNLHESLSSFLSETHCKSSWKTQTMDLEDIYNQYSNQVRKENKNSIKDNSNPPKNSSKQTDCGKLDDTSQESPEALNEEDKRKKKKSEDKDLIINDEKETSTNIENGNTIKEKSKPSKTSRKNKESGKLDKSFQEALEVPKEEEKKKKKKKNFEDKDLIDNNEQKTSIDREKKSVKDSSKPSKVSNKLKVSSQLDESLQESLEVPKQKRKKEQEAEDEDSGDDANQNASKKNKKDTKRCKKKILSPSSNVTIEEATKSNLNDLAENTDKSLFDNTPGQKGVKEDEGEANISSNSKQKSGEPTTAKAFQRVKVEEVQFVDPRLQDNSYWAKSGAEIGYGAKAEQVLGQVRGKDFRHEKTKKKRGSYKGGMIDLQSHSIKFSYSDEE